ncbi:hypothetical protein H6P81_016081 [Aristolochia fimbriata]|uniref:non-specific serine/threonine protein kinase n=1 Tax=Aristolochia fimbriata TaxID=158543 RepID=A0AAV7E8J3_ARIFI|nr:hypothetical protein H6P81_016081 [Aristolochia fimbriata]
MKDIPLILKESIYEILSLFWCRNLVANNFVLDSSNNSLPSGLNCLQRGFPCNRVSPCYQGTYGPSVSAISVEPNFEPSVDNVATGNKNRTGLIVGLAVGVGFLSFISVFAIMIWRRRIKGIDRDEELISLNSKADMFSYVELRNATNDFNPLNKLERVALDQFIRVHFQMGGLLLNLVKLYGCCLEGDRRFLVYEYLENKSLDQALFGRNNLSLDWVTRFGICMGTARGLAYLHESRLRIVHRDVKASNILLEANLNAKISDFGLAKLYDEKKTHMSTGVAGTFGYLAPEYAK